MFLDVAIPLKISFRRNRIMPIVDVCIASDVALSPQSLLKNAIRIIESSEQFKGVLLDSSPCFFTSGKYTVAFSLTFPSIDVCNKFVKYHDSSAKD